MNLWPYFKILLNLYCDKLRLLLYINLLPHTTGQFWNREVSVTPFTGVDRNGNPVPERYVINLSSPTSGEERTFTGWYYDLTWEFEDGPCLYAGNRQAGPIYEIQEPNDSVIEGRYKEYMVNSAFSEVEYTYGLFNEDRCA